MDVFTYDSRVVREVTEPPRVTPSPCQDSRPRESFVDHLQAEPPPASQDAAHDATPPVNVVEETPDDPQANTEEQDPDPVDETGTRNDSVAASAQEASTALSQSGSAEQPKPVTVTDSRPASSDGPQSAAAADAHPVSPADSQLVSATDTRPVSTTGSRPGSAAERPQPIAAAGTQASDSTQRATETPTDVLPAGVSSDARSGVEPMQPEQLAAQAAVTAGATPPRTGHTAAAANAAPMASTAKRPATTTTLSQGESTPVTVPGTGGLPIVNHQAVVDPAAGPVEQTDGTTPGEKAQEKTASKARRAGAAGQSGESPDPSGTKSDAVVRSVEELQPALRAVDAVTTELASGAERTDVSTTTTGQDAEARTDPSVRAPSLAERLPDQLFGRSSSDLSGSQEITQPDQMRLIQRVARAIEAAPQQGGLLRLRLRPPELGAVRLEVLVERGNLVARIETETQQARNVLLEHLPQLRDRLTAQGIHVEQFDVNVSSRDSGETPFQSHNSEETRPLSLARRRAAAASDASTDMLRAPDLSVNSSPGKLNVVI